MPLWSTPSAMPKNWKSWQPSKRTISAAGNCNKWQKSAVVFRPMLPRAFTKCCNITGLSISESLPSSIPGILSIPGDWTSTFILFTKQKQQPEALLKNKPSRSCSLSGSSSTTIRLLPKWALPLRRVTPIPISRSSITEALPPTVKMR